MWVYDPRRVAWADLEDYFYQLDVHESQLHLVLQLPGFGMLSALAILAAIGDITRFPDAKHLVGYAGLGARIHDSGLTTRSGKITKAGRKDLRAALVEAAQVAANFHPFWKAELARLEPRLGRNKAIVAIARRLLVAVWHVLSKQTVDCHAEPEHLARKFIQVAHSIGKHSRPEGQTAVAFARQQLDRLHYGQHLTHVRWGSKKPPLTLPPSSLLSKTD